MDGEDIIENGRLFTSECTRTLGDFGIKKHCFGVISTEPEFTIHKIKHKDRSLILACDGIWRTIDNQLAAELIWHETNNPTYTNPAQVLVSEAVSKGSGDDQTCIVIDLMNYKLYGTQYNSDIAAKILKGISIYDSKTAQQAASSAHRPFTAKLAQIHKVGGFKGRAERTVFDVDAAKTQAIVSSVQRVKKFFSKNCAYPLCWA